MDMLELVRLNLLSPVVLAFALGIAASRMHSDLRLPESVYTGLSIYLLLAIGLKGGAELAVTPLAEVWAPALVTLLLGAATPLWSYAILRRLGKLDIANAAAIAAHYGSVSAVTFLATLSFLDAAQVAYEGYGAALVALLEVPAIVVALLLAHRRLGAAGGGLKEAVEEVLTGKSILLLGGGLVIGWLSGPGGLDKVEGFFVVPFYGALVLFLLELGVVTGRRLDDLRKVGPFLLGFGIVMPIVHGVLGILLAKASGMSMGGATVLAVLAASASYIAAPAAVRLALPQASPGLYLTASLAITFPFNLTVGIPLFFAIARMAYPEVVP